MKKSIIAFVLILCMTFVFVGCDSSEDIIDDTATADTIAVETTPTNVTVIFNAFTYNGVEHKFTLVYEGDSVDKEFNNLAFSANVGETVEQVLDNAGYSDMQMVEVQDTFQGFMEYKMVTDEELSVVTYEKLSDTLYTVDEVMEKTVPQYSVVYVARWEQLDDDYYAAYGY